jgi:hypothetical protein
MKIMVGVSAEYICIYISAAIRLTARDPQEEMSSDFTHCSSIKCAQGECV